MAAAVEVVRRAEAGCACQRKPAGVPDGLDTGCKKEKGYFKVFAWIDG